MSNVVRFPIGRRVLAKPIPREEFEQLADLALDVVQRIVTLLDEEDTHDAFNRPRGVSLSFTSSEPEIHDDRDSQ